VHKNQERFFKKQKFIQFQKVWYFWDHVKKENNNPDMNYLSSFEEKYKINLWTLLYAERSFTDYNSFYKFKDEKILSLLEQECKFYEKVLDEIKPDFLVIRPTDYHHLHLLVELCKSKKIQILMLIGTRFRNTFLISNDEINPTTVESALIEKQESKDFAGSKPIEELKNFFNDYGPTRDPLISFPKHPLHSWKRIQRILGYYLPTKPYNTDHYYTYGKTKSKMLIDKFTSGIKRRSRESFLNRNCIRKIDDKKPFVYFPMHTEPERTILIGAPYYTNQIAVIENVAKSLPIGYTLYVKDHPTMWWLAWRSKSYYKEILRLPNVKLIHPFVKHEELLEKCSLVITVVGSVGLEAGFFKKSVILLGYLKYADYLPYVHVEENILKLPQTIRSVLKEKVDPLSLNSYVNFVEKNSFLLEWQKLRLIFFKRYYSGNLAVDDEIQISEIKSYLEEQKPTFERVALEHIKKIKQLKQQDLKK